jgi:hypothetical protein
MMPSMPSSAVSLAMIPPSSERLEQSVVDR